MYTQNEKLDLIIEELHTIAVELKNYNQIGNELLQIQRRMLEPPTDYNIPPVSFDERRNHSFDRYRY